VGNGTHGRFKWKWRLVTAGDGLTGSVFGRKRPVKWRKRRVVAAFHDGLAFTVDTDERPS
jgi:hypothetical protein